MGPRLCRVARWFLVTLAALLVLCSCARTTKNEAAYWLGFYNGKHTVGNYGIGIATAASIAAGFTRVSTTSPIVAPPGYQHIVAPCVVRVEDLFYMYVEGFATETGTWRDVLLYTSRDGMAWALHPDNPVLTIAGGARRCSVLYEPSDPKDPFKMWYVRSSTLDIAYASSADGVHWATRGNAVLTHGGAGAWDADQVIAGGVVKEGATYWLFYAGFDGARYQGGCATATNPAGPYEKAAANPIVRSRAGAEQRSTGNVPAGSTRLSVADSSVFCVDEPVVICNRLGRWEVNRVASLPSPNTLVLNDPVRQPYSVADETWVRSWASQDVHTTCVWKEDDTWHAVITAFGCQKGLTCAVNFMVELTGYMTGPSPGDLRFVLSQSPLLPLTSSLDSFWDQCSRENLWLVRAGVDSP